MVSVCDSSRGIRRVKARASQLFRFPLAIRHAEIVPTPMNLHLIREKVGKKEGSVKFEQ
jgi:hypothetical protein